MLQGIFLEVHHASETGDTSLAAKMEQLYTQHQSFLIGALGCGLILILALFMEIRKALRAHRVAHDARLELETVINAMPLSIDSVDREHGLTLLNKFGRKTHGIDAFGEKGKLQTACGPYPMLDHLNEEIFETGKAVRGIEVTGKQLEAGSRTWLVSKEPVLSSTGEVSKIVTVGVDITERKTAEAQIKHMAQHDALTDLPNRSLFQRRLSSALVRSRDAGAGISLLYVDFDRFKAINDDLGHEAGDRFLIHAAKLMRSCLRPSDTLARLGGDEFAVLREGAKTSQETDHLAERLTAAFTKPINVDGQQWYSTISVGISRSPEGGAEPAELLRQADIALYEAKAGGGNTWRAFEPRMRKKRQYRRSLQHDLRHAIENEELVLHYQPKIRLSDRRVSGFEALLRWKHPRHGPIPPSDFIPVAEACDLIAELGQFVLRKTCDQIVAWRNNGVDPPPIAINLSAAQFVRQPVTTMVLQMLQEKGVPPELLELEVTESILLAGSDAVLESLHTLRALNIGVTLDDFGTGYSSLSYLRRFPINKIKIDKAFVQSIHEDKRDDLAIVRAIIAMAHSLDVTVVAEGVETEAQYAILEQMGCDEIQGFYLSRAEPAERLSHWFRHSVSSCASRAPAKRQLQLNTV
jgi:diguanylate cyclase (GGDEF)-like protein